MSSNRFVPYFCPYCADEVIRPHGEKHGEWECRSCLRAFRLASIGQLHPDQTTTIAAPTGRRTAS